MRLTTLGKGENKTDIPGAAASAPGGRRRQRSCLAHAALGWHRDRDFHLQKGNCRHQRRTRDDCWIRGQRAERRRHLLSFFFFFFFRWGISHVCPTHTPDRQPGENRSSAVLQKKPMWLADWIVEVNCWAVWRRIGAAWHSFFLTDESKTRSNQMQNYVDWSLQAERGDLLRER